MSYTELSNQLSGEIVTPGDDRYESERKIYNAMIDKHPDAIVKCKSDKDVVHAVNYARNNNMEVAIRGGGHNGAGLSVVDNGLVIDLSLMNKVTVNPDTKTAVVQAGCLLKDIDTATSPHGLALPVGVVSSTGIAGLTLGGGLGYLTRRGGLTIDNLIECKVVLASGELVTANKSVKSDLFWALKGGGGNFGVVVSFEFNLLPIDKIYAGPMFWPIEQATDLMKFYNDFTRKADNDLYGFFAFLVVPDGDPFPHHLRNKNVCGIVWNYTGSMENANEIFEPIRNFGTPILDFVDEMSVQQLNSLFDELYPPGLYWHWRAHYINELTDEAIKTNIEFGSKIPSMLSTSHLYPVDGACHEVGNDKTPWAHRDTRWVQLFAAIHHDPEEVKNCAKWSKAYHDAISPFSSGGGYINFLMNESDTKIQTSFKENYKRLAQIKTKYDPDNFFHVNQNIKPID